MNSFPIFRFYDPQSGSINLDGINIKDLNIKWLRSQIGYVGQEPVLFAGTIAENIAFGLDIDFDKYASDGSLIKWANFPQNIQDRIVSATQLANAYEFIMAFPSGFDTDVGSNGVSMSGGQKQRIAISRALVKRPAVLLLDEATSALDASSEKLVQQSIDELQKSHAQTTVVVAHRLSTIRNADKICVVEGGLIAEIGTHSELIAKNGR
jgi:ATP-binding cassette subfamily B (MDR/TAP) protein 1